MRKFTLLIASLFIAIGAMAQTNSYTRIADFEAARTNSTVYALKTTRSPLYFNTEHNELAAYWTSESQTLQGSVADATATAQQFAFLRTDITEENKYYMYSVEGSCFITSAGAKSDTPDAYAYFVNVTDKADASHLGLKLYLGTTGDNVVNATWWNSNTAGGIRYNTNTEADDGNVYELIAFDETVDLSEAVAKIEAYEATLYPYNGKIYALESYMDYLYQNTDGSMNIYTNGSYNGVADTRALWKFEYNNGVYNIKNVHTGLYIGATNHNTSAQMSETPGSYEIATTVGSETVTEGKLYIKVNGQNACLHSTAATAKGWEGGGLGNQYIFTEITEFSHTLNVTDAGWATLVLGFNATIPTADGFKAYKIASEEDGYVTLEEVTGVLQANVPVLVNAPAGNYNFAYTTDEATVTESGLQGTLYNKDITVAGAYVLGLIDGEAGFGLATTTGKAEGTFTNNANKAYFVPTNTLANAASYSFRFGEGTTGIDEITDNREQSTVIYDLTGRRVETITEPGIYIVGGKKVLVK